MTDESNELRATLARLHQQLHGTADVSVETRALLKEVLEDIHSLVDRAAAAPAGSGTHDASQESIVRRLAAAEREFEVTHPTLAGIVGSVIDALGRMGI